MADVRSGFVVFFTGLPASGKSTLARALYERLSSVDPAEAGRHDSRPPGRPVTLLDGDVVRQQFSADLGFTKADRDTQIRRVSAAAADVAKSGGIALCSVIAPYDAARREARALIRRAGDFVLVFLSAPLEACEARDPKGLYRKARAGEISHFTGVSDPYEPPTDAEIAIDTTMATPEQAADRVMAYLRSAGLV